MNNTHILIVEDSHTQAERLKIILESQNYTVSVAFNGQEALNFLQNALPTIIISDIIMPEMDGYELCKNLRLSDKFKVIPIVLLTTLSDTEDIVNGLECGANYFISKPYEDDFLLLRIQEILTARTIRQSDPLQADVRIILHGKEHTITANKSQILDLLVSTYEDAVQKNKQLNISRLKVQELNNTLELKVKERTNELNIEMNNNITLYKESKIYAENLEKEITQRKQLEIDLRQSEEHFRELSSQLKVSLDAKEALLKEVFHRVKNNLQIISSLLSLHIQSVEDKTIKDNLIKSASRVKSMDLVHQLLYQGDNLSHISMIKYVNDLFSYCRGIYDLDNDLIKFKSDIDDIYLDMDTAIPIGLIMNELVSNAVKHAFPQQKSGIIQVSLTSQNNNFVLVVRDNGIGINPQLRLNEVPTLGLQIVNNLVNQLQGKVEVDSQSGTVLKIMFS